MHPGSCVRCESSDVEISRTSDTTTLMMIILRSLGPLTYYIASSTPQLIRSR